MVIMIHTWLRGRGIWDEEENVVDIYLYGYNIRNERYGGIESALYMIVQGNMYLGFYLRRRS